MGRKHTHCARIAHVATKYGATTIAKTSGVFSLTLPAFPRQAESAHISFRRRAMIKPVGYVSKYGLKNLSQGFNASICPETSKYLVHEVPVFTLSQVRELVSDAIKRSYMSGWHRAGCGLGPNSDDVWEKSDVKALLDAIAAQAAGGEG
jgi:hypothetical protein